MLSVELEKALRKQSKATPSMFWAEQTQAYKHRVPL